MEKPIKLTITYDEYITIFCALQEYRNMLFSEDLKSKAERTKEKVQDQYIKHCNR